MATASGDTRTTGQPVAVSIGADAGYPEWRDKARDLVARRLLPERVEWQAGDPDTTGELGLFDGTPEPVGNVEPAPKMRIKRDFHDVLQTALMHSAADRFAVAYRLLWKTLDRPDAHRNPADADVKKLDDYRRSVGRDIHKMHAFVRFRKTGISGDGREQFVAWFEPEHHIVDAVAPFFRNRFNGMDWIIVTPRRSIGWDGKTLSHGPGGTKSDVPAEDRMEAEWRTYYSSIFNPARVKTNAMKSEMPVKYWKNLPEAQLIEPLVRQASGRVQRMVETASPTMLDLNGAEPNSASERSRSMDSYDSLDALYAALDVKDEPPSEGFSNRVVRGEGPVGAPLMFVGEQPGDVEDEQGRPFVGPAGQLLMRAMEKASIDRDDAYVTNAVKRFKYVQRGKRRVHQSPSVGDINHYRWWLDQEIGLVKPKLIVALGGTAARALVGKAVTISRSRGMITPRGDGNDLLITVHPSYLLRLPDEEGKRIEYEKFVRDLDMAAAAA